MYDEYGDRFSSQNNDTYSLTVAGSEKASEGGDSGTDVSTSFDTK